MTELPSLTTMYDNYQADGADFYSFILGFGPKAGLADYVNAHPELHCTEWLWDGYQLAWPYYRDAFGLTHSVPSHFIIDRDGYIRFGMIGTGGVPGVLTACIDELL